MATPNPHVSEISPEKESRIRELLQATKQWPAKDGMKLQQNQKKYKKLHLGEELMHISDLLLEVEEHLLSNKCHPQLAKEQLQKAKQILDRIDTSQYDTVWDDEPRIRGRIYGDGDGSAYESKIYKEIGIDSVPDGIDELITICDDISDRIYK